VFELGRLHRTQNDFVALAEQRLRAVCAKTGHTGYISVLDGAEQVVLRVVPGSNPLQVVTPPAYGRRPSRHPTAAPCWRA
jgi:DNA-binding IclR family transcriptional regulator